MDEALVEKVARAICRAFCLATLATGIPPRGLDREVDRTWRKWQAEARAAIAAMQEYEPERPADIPMSAD